TGPFVAVMNPDCELEPDALARLVAELRAHDDLAIVGPRILNPDRSLEYSARGFPEAMTFLFNRYSLMTKLFPRNRWSRRYLLSDWDHASVRDVDWVTGACMMVRRAAIEQVGGMDEAFFMFNEDVDWCRRMRLAGWTITYVPSAEILHHVGASRGPVTARVIVERHRGMIHYFRKHHPANPVVAACTDGFIMARAGVMLALNALKRPR
ncbi:MAG TPA: glycosyltransferase family 2 protein, partial [Candidatus Eisenbacteria bacterium]